MKGKNEKNNERKICVAVKREEGRERENNERWI